MEAIATKAARSIMPENPRVELTIDLSTYGARVYSGRKNGEDVRENTRLDQIESDPNAFVTIIVPEDTQALNNSFLLGMLEKSIKRAGSREQFHDRYNVKVPARFREGLERAIERALRRKMPFMSR